MTPSDLRRSVASLRDDLVELARELVRRPSVTGEETETQRFLAGLWRDWGLEVDLWIPERDLVASHAAFCDDGLPLERPNLVARWGEGPASAPAALILNGHIDVVPPGARSSWSRDPFSGEIADGRLFGRGACDMKGGLAAASIAVRAVQRLGVVPRRPILLQSVVGEETGGLGTLAAILRGYSADAAVIAEPTGLALCTAHSGALSFRLRVRGKATHGATRRAGVSAIDKFFVVAEALGALERSRHERFRHPLFDPDALAAPISIGRLEAGSWPSTVPDEAVAEGRYGVFVGEDCGEARAELEAAVRRAAAEDDWLRSHPVAVEWFEGQFEPGEADPAAPALRRLAACHRAVTGTEPAVRGVPYGSDLRLFTRYAEMPAALYGPGDVLLAHAADESVELDELLAAAEVFALLVAACAEGEDA